MNRVKTPPQTGSSEPDACSLERDPVKCRSYLTRLKRGVKVNRTPRLRHSSYFAITSSVTNTIPVGRPIRSYCLESGAASIKVRTAVPSGGETATHLI